MKHRGAEGTELDGPDEILGGYQGHMMADCCSENMSVVLAPGSVGSKPGGLVHPLPGSKASLQVQSKIREARRADTQDLLRHYSQAALRAVGPLNPPPLTPPAKAPVEKGGQAVGWSGRDV